jgi:iron complex outermembrane receptor protein
MTVRPCLTCEYEHGSPLLRRSVTTLLGAALACSSAFVSALPESIESSTSALKRMSLDDLMNVEVTSVSRTQENLYGAAAAIAVVSGDDIRRSGATSIPEALRMVPGLHVARRNSSYWAMGARGFSSSNSEKLLVLSDTRSLYTPLFSGVLWDAQEYVLDDIERIEVIRGPGAALWGSNAVNGVINITTKSAKDTQGGYLAALAGTEEEAGVAARYGTALNDALHVRVFAKHAERDETFRRARISSDDWRQTLVGFRADWDASTADAVTIQGGAYRGEVGQYSPAIEIAGRAGPTGDLNTRFNGGNVLARWRRNFSDDADLQLRFYFDRTQRNDPSFRDDLDTYDIDLQHRFLIDAFAGLPSQEIIWGVNYRFTDNENVGRGIFNLDPNTSTDAVASAFVQDQLALGDRVRLTLGSKFEHNDFSGFELQPSIRATWDVAAEVRLWSAISRAVRVPTRLERDVAIDLSDNPASNPVARLLGNDDFESEELVAYELGARWQARADLFLDLAAFHQRYEGLVSLELGAPFVDPRDGRVVIPIVDRNLTDGQSEGIEALATYVATPHWRLTASYAYVDLELDPHGQDLNRGRFYEGATPRHQLGLRSALDLTDSLQIDVQFRTMSAVRTTTEIATGAGIGGYSELDARIGWQATQQLEISIVGQNLLHDKHVEFGSPAARGEIERGVYGKIAWDF